MFALFQFVYSKIRYLTSLRYIDSIRRFFLDLEFVFSYTFSSFSDVKDLENFFLGCWKLFRSNLLYYLRLVFSSGLTETRVNLDLFMSDMLNLFWFIENQVFVMIIITKILIHLIINKDRFMIQVFTLIRHWMTQSVILSILSKALNLIIHFMEWL